MQHISKISHYRKQNISKTTTNEKNQQISINDKSQKPTNLKKQQISKNNTYVVFSVLF